jgi:prepilin-type N-terminal cleavage/methylation domain-containing protein
MVPGGIRRELSAGGFTIVEVMVACAIMGILAVVATPFFSTYFQSAATKSAAEELATVLNGARQLAIARNTNVCVSLSGAQALYKTGTSTTCGGGNTYVGTLTRTDGTMRLDNNMTISASTASVVFSSLGAAVNAGTYTVRNPTTAQTLNVVVAASGRISIQ